MLTGGCRVHFPDIEQCCFILIFHLETQPVALTVSSTDCSKLLQASQKNDLSRVFSSTRLWQSFTSISETAPQPGVQQHQTVAKSDKHIRNSTSAGCSAASSLRFLPLAFLVGCAALAAAFEEGFAGDAGRDGAEESRWSSSAEASSVALSTGTPVSKEKSASPTWLVRSAVRYA